MPTMSANNAKARFGELLDTARRQPVTIEKHGRPVAVVMSTEDYEDLQAIKLAMLRTEIGIGLEALRRGDFAALDQAALERMADAIKMEGRKQTTK